MKISYLKLVNFAGIYAGLGLNEIELDFTKSKNVINMLLGSNGCGKSVIQTNLTPFRDTNDSRKKLIIEGQDGYKEIHLVDNKNIYIIKHYYGEKSKDNKSYISKNGKEMNENGGIKTYNNYLKSEFELDTDYLKVGRLGAGLDTFVKLNSSDRKKFIGNFIPDIDDILKAHDSAKTNYNYCVKEIRKLENSMEKIGSIDTIENTKILCEKELDNYEKQRDRLNKEITKLETENSMLLNKKTLDILKNECRELEKEEIKISKQINENTETLNALYEKYNNLKNYALDDIDRGKRTCNENIIKSSSKLEVLNSKKEDMTSKINELEDKISSTKTNSLNEDDYETWIEMEEALIEEEEGLTTEYNRYKEYRTNHTITELNTMKFTCLEKQKAVETLISSYDVNKYEDNKMRPMEKLENTLTLLKMEKDKINEEINRIQTNSKLIDILDKRPTNCNIPTCPFIAHALKAQKDIESLERLHDEINEANSVIGEVTERIEEYSQWNKYILEVQGIWKKYYKDMDIEDLFGIIKSGNINNIVLKEIEKIDASMKYMSIKQDLLNTSNRLENIQNKIRYHNNMKENNDKIEKEFEKHLKEKEELIVKLNDMNAEFVETEKNLRKHTKKLAILETVEDSIKYSDDTKDKHQQLVESIDKYKENISMIHENNVNKNEYESELKNYIKSIQQVSSRIDVLKNELFNAKKIKETYTDLKGNLEYYEYIKKSTDPKEGMPLVAIDNYLTSISSRANELLDIAYDGKFQIDFDITDKDFFIKVLKSNGTELNDIKEASQGELGMTTTSISLALMEQSINHYNIVYLDEVDATLSTENRRKFIEIIKNQIDTLGLEQIFIISHNNEFNAHPMDLILLKDPEIDLTDKDVMENKSIIYKY